MNQIKIGLKFLIFTLLLTTLLLITGCHTTITHVSRTAHSIGIRQHALTNPKQSLAFSFEVSPVIYDDMIIFHEITNNEAGAAQTEFNYTAQHRDARSIKSGLGVEYGLTKYTTIDGGISYVSLGKMKIEDLEDFTPPELDFYDAKYFRYILNTRRLEWSAGIKQALINPDYKIALSTYASYKFSDFNSSNEIDQYDASTRELVAGLLTGYSFNPITINNLEYTITPTLGAFYFSSNSHRKLTMGSIKQDLAYDKYGYEFNLHIKHKAAFFVGGMGIQQNFHENLDNLDYYGFLKMGVFIFNGI